LGTERHCHGLGAWCSVFLFDRAGWMIVRRRAANERQRCDQPPQEFATAAHHQDPLLKTKISRIGEPAMLNHIPRWTAHPLTLDKSSRKRSRCMRQFTLGKKFIQKTGARLCRPAVAIRHPWLPPFYARSAHRPSANGPATALTWRCAVSIVSSASPAYKPDDESSPVCLYRRTILPIERGP